jgi:hypothetical protein
MGGRVQRPPHLTVLDIVEHALGVAVRAIVTDFPALIGEPHPWRPDSPDQRAARRMLHRMIRFERSLARYRRALPRLLTPPAADSPDDVDI